MANHYRSVLASGGGVQPTGDAVAADVLTGKTFSNANAVGIAGTMPNNGAVSGTAAPSQPYTIPAGYHNGSGVVTATSNSETVLNLNNANASTISAMSITFKGISSISIDSYTANNTSGGAQIIDSDTSQLIYSFASGTQTNVVIDCSDHPNVTLTRPGSANFTLSITNMVVS